MPLTSASTLAELKAAYDDNVGYDLDNSVSMAKEFIKACRMLLQRVPKRMRHGGQGGDEMEIDPAQVAKQLEAAEQWWQANDPNAALRSGGGGAVQLTTSEGFRD